MGVLQIAFIVFQMFVRCLLQEDLSTFPEGFWFGAGTAAFAVEGGWNADGKGWSLWDRITHEIPWVIEPDGSYNVTEQAEIAADSYHKWQDDVRVAKQIGLQYYKFSISWARILPKGLPNEINQAGVDYYNNLINELISANIIPVVTLLHYDTTAIGDVFFGGFANEMSTKAFPLYADVVFGLFGDRVQNWVTINNPYKYCKEIFGEAIGKNYVYFPTGLHEYECGRNALLAHAHTYRLYKEKYKKSQKGQITMTLQLDWYEPATYSPEDIEAAARAMDFSFGWFAYPLTYGTYPQRMIDTIAELSRQQNFSFSRLIPFTEEETKKIKGSLDHMALIPLQTYLVSDNRTLSIDNDVQVTKTFKDEWRDPNDIYVRTPKAFRRSLKYVWDNYQQQNMAIAEHGYGALEDSLEDTFRIDFMGEYLKQLILVIKEDKVNITAYAVWSLIDLYNFQDAYKATFGLAKVDFNDPNRPRTLKTSATYYRDIIESKMLL